MKNLKEAFITKKNIKNIKIEYKWPNPFNISEKDIKNTWAEGYPIEILTLALFETKLQGRKQYDFKMLIFDRLTGAFSWPDSTDGYMFWINIDNGIFDEFYKRYTPKKLRDLLESI